MGRERACPSPRSSCPAGSPSSYRPLRGAPQRRRKVSEPPPCHFSPSPRRSDERPGPLRPRAPARRSAQVRRGGHGGGREGAHDRALDRDLRACVAAPRAGCGRLGTRSSSTPSSSRSSARTTRSATCSACASPRAVCCRPHGGSISSSLVSPSSSSSSRPLSAPRRRARVHRHRRQLLQDPAVTFAGYQIPHPLVNDVIIKVQTEKGTSPGDAFLRACGDLRVVFDGIDRAVTVRSGRSEGEGVASRGASSSHSWWTDSHVSFVLGAGDGGGLDGRARPGCRGRVSCGEWARKRASERNKRM